MKIFKFLLPTFALGLAGILITPSTASSWSVLGFNLNVFFRSARIYNNFTAAGANNNTTGHPQFPGATGAELALWKATVEWGSEPHGDGTGDPSQAVIGSGNANFDVHFIGEAIGVGVIGHNIMSQLGGCQGGVFAFMQGGSNGWWIRFLQCWNWADGPASIGGGEADLQGIGCHEYGHALGLGHSNVGNATMFSSASTGSISERSIEADDMAGLQFIYGAKIGTKPKITKVDGFGGSPITITGTNFPASVNVWFRAANPTQVAAIAPVKVFGVPTNGTSLTVTPPANAGQGDVLVRNPAFVTGHGLSNAMPWDPTACPDAKIYCVSKPGLTCGTPFIGVFGQSSASSANGFFITAGPTRANKAGLLIHTDQGKQSVPFLGGTLCIQTPLKRSVAINSGGFSACDGEFAIDMNAFASGAQGGNPSAFLTSVGTTINAQWWGRDSVATGSFLSDAVEYVVCP